MGRSPCCDETGLRKGTWTPEEDRKLIAYVTRYGSWNWRQLPKFAGLQRCGKSCRLRWLNYLRPGIKRGNFTQQEEDTIIDLHEKLGNRWIVIASNLPGRTDNEIKNHWHTILKKRLIKINKSDTNNGTVNSKDTHSDNNPTMEEDKKHEGELQNNSRPNITSPSSSIPSSSGTTDTQPTTELSYENYVLDELPLMDAYMDVLNDNFWTEPYIIDTNSDNPRIEEDNTFKGVLENNSGPNSTSQLSSIPSSTLNGPSCITMDTAATRMSNENHLLDELRLMDAYMDVLNDNFWTEPYIIDNSYVPPSEEATLLAEGYEHDYYFSPVYDATTL